MSKLITNFIRVNDIHGIYVFFSRNLFRCLAPFSDPLNECAPGPRAIRSHPPFDIRCPAHPKWCVPSLFLHCFNYCNLRSRRCQCLPSPLPRPTLGTPPACAHSMPSDSGKSRHPTVPIHPCRAQERACTRYTVHGSRS